MEKDSSDHRFLAFMSMEESLAGDGWLVAVLVTDLSGVPQEFRCTHPVKPTVVQKALYGDALEPHIAVELCGRPLWGQITRDPDVLFVKDELLLDLRPSIGCRLVLVRRGGQVIEVTSVGVDRAPSGNVDAPHGRFQPVTMTTHPSYAEDFTPGRVLVERAFSHFDVIEPFDRISTAVRTLAEQDERFR